MRISLIVAMSTNRVIGRDGDLPWRLSADLQRFKQLTMGHHIVMGRKTFESIGRPLPGRTMIVITRQENYATEVATVAHSLDTAIATAQQAGDEEVFIIGGGEIYRQALDIVDRIYLTRVHADIEGDTCFPEITTDEWRLVTESNHVADEKNNHAHTYSVFDRPKNQ